jgi:hypothetical protein
MLGPEDQYQYHLARILLALLNDAAAIYHWLTVSAARQGQARRNLADDPTSLGPNLCQTPLEIRHLSR